MPYSVGWLLVETQTGSISNRMLSLVGWMNIWRIEVTTSIVCIRLHQLATLPTPTNEANSLCTSRSLSEIFRNDFVAPVLISACLYKQICKRTCVMAFFLWTCWKLSQANHLASTTETPGKATTRPNRIIWCTPHSPTTYLTVNIQYVVSVPPALRKHTDTIWTHMCAT